mmetsp:Transcript_3486/g.7565  ORF Transcript_3486/g.7565 Transcript_3486/m.7565 type:complete len:359 (+) Transcript_3486:739-1815(+)
MVGGDGGAPGVVDAARDGIAGRHGTVGNLPEMEDVLSVALDVVNPDGGTGTGRDDARVVDLSASLGVEGRPVKDDPYRSTIGRDGIDEANPIVGFVPTDEECFGRTTVEIGVPLILGGIVGGIDSPPDEVRSLLGHQAHILPGSAHHLGLVGGRAEFLLLPHLGIEGIPIDGHPQLFGHQFGKINRKTHGRVEEVCIDAREHLILTNIGIGQLLEFDEALIESLGERFLLLLDDGGNVRLILAELGERIPHELNYLGHQPGEETKIGTEILTSVPNGTTQNATEDVTPPIVAGRCTIGNGKAKRTDMIGDDPVRHVDVTIIFCTNLPSIRSGTGYSPNLIKDGDKDIGIVIRINALQD